MGPRMATRRHLGALAWPWASVYVLFMAQVSIVLADDDMVEPTTLPTSLPTISAIPSAAPTPEPTPAPTKDLNKFMCFTGRNSCPDDGAQSRSCGKNDASCPGDWKQEGSAAGTLTVAVHQGIYMPDSDGNVGASGFSDPFVEAIVRRRDREGSWTDVAHGETHHVDSDLSPVWNEELNLGGECQVEKGKASPHPPTHTSKQTMWIPSHLRCATRLTDPPLANCDQFTTRVRSSCSKSRIMTLAGTASTATTCWEPLVTKGATKK